MGCGKSSQKNVDENAQQPCKVAAAAPHNTAASPPEACAATSHGTPGNVATVSKIPSPKTNEKSPRAKLTFFLLGGPGSGRGSLSTRMADEYDFVRISVGDLLKEEVKKGSAAGTQVDQFLKERKLVPDDISLKLLKDTIQAHHTNPYILIDNFPTTVAQAISFEEQVGQPDMVIYVECPMQKMEERLLHGPDNIDDNSEKVTKSKIERFQRECLPIVAHYEKSHPLQLKRVKGSLEMSELFSEVASLMKENYAIEARSVLVHKRHDCSKLKYIFILGGPGSGKGTQCNKMVRDFGYTHISTGDLLRNEVKAGTPTGAEIDRLMREGKLVPLQITTNLLENAIKSAKCKNFLIDGYPRSVEQAHAFETKIGKPTLVINLVCSISTMETRLIERGKSSNRADDNIETIKKRFDAYEKESRPVVDHYKSMKGDLLKEVSAEKDPDQVYKEIKDNLLKSVEHHYQKK